MKFKYFISGGVPNLVKFSNNYTGCRNLMLASILEHSKYPEQYQNELVKLENSFNNTSSLKLYDPITKFSFFIMCLISLNIFTI